MKICMISEAQSAHTKRWAAALAEAGCEMHLVSASPANIPGVQLHAMPIYDPGPIRQWKNIRAIRKQIDKIKPDLVHLFGLFSLSSLGAMILAQKLAMIVSVWGSDIIPGGDQETRQEWFIKRYLLRRAHRIVALSEYLARETAAYAPRGAHIDVVPWGVDLELFQPPTKQRESSELRIGFAKKLTELSAPDVLINAFALLRERTSKNVSLWIAGNGPMENRLRQQAKELKLENNIQWVGWIENQERLRDFFHSIDIFVQPSRRESFGVSAAQAAACGLPVIASRFGGIPEVVIDRKTGFLTTPENEEELSEAILSLIHGPGLRSSMGAAGRKWVQQNFEWKTCVAKMIKIYEECHAQKRRSKSR